MKKNIVAFSLVAVASIPKISWGYSGDLESYFFDLRQVLIQEELKVYKTDYKLDLFSDIYFENEDDKSTAIIRYAFEELGKPYKFAATGPDYYDCSGYTYTIFKKLNINIPRTSEAQGNGGILIDRNRLQKGDLVFFDTRSISNINDITDNFEEEIISSEPKPFMPEKVTHVGIYIGSGEFIHASSGGGEVIISRLDNKYYDSRYLHGRRYL
ncbi:cell wall-associated NlpC family hydrolase [Acetoanaerobium pronyense]|uniref:Cell wall-associated NlpC family hydrolase n=1 Tax=Acetoanaerobium pronyense TaxID=1482736 RepID=A0ABS4KK94_9FIRM|nr:cell wall-associated NlpC family hydrolase [Acetoanaerobium pronyense]